MGAESCCKSVQIAYSQNLSQTFHKSIDSAPKNQYFQTLRNMGQMQLLASIGYQTQLVSSSPQYLSNITSNFQSLDQFIQLLDNNYCQNPPFLHLLQSKVYQINQPRYDAVQSKTIFNEIAIVHQPKLPSSQKAESKAESKAQSTAIQNLKAKLKILQFLRMTQSELENQQQFIKTLCLTLHSIPDSQSYLWDVSPKSNISEMAKHLHYKLNSYIQFLNSYISLNDPLSLLNIKYFLQFSLRFLCKTQRKNQGGSIQCRLKINELERLLIPKGSWMMTVNFLKFTSKSADKTKVSNEQVLLILQESRSKRSNKIRHMTSFYVLPFTLFDVVEVVREGKQTKIYLSELQDQNFLNQLAKPFSDTPIQQKEIYVSIHKQNLRTQLQSLNNKYQLNIKDYLQKHKNQQEDSNMPHLSQIIQKQYSEYKKYHSTKSNTRLSAEEQQRRSHILNSRQAVQQRTLQSGLNERMRGETGQSGSQIDPIQSECELISLTNTQIKDHEKRLSAYIKQFELEKLSIQLQQVDYFFYLTQLNLSHCYLQKIEYMHCFPNLKELFLYSNDITKLQGLQKNASLRLLSVSRNKIQKLENIEHLKHLRELYLTKNGLGKDSAEYLTRKELRLVHSLSISFAADQDACFQLICKNSAFKLLKLTINQSQLIKQRTKNQLIKKFNKATIQFCI